MSNKKIRVEKSTARGKNYVVVLETGDKVKLDQETVFRHGIFTDSSFTPKRWVEILEEAQREACYQRLLSVLQRRPHTETELRRKLFQRKFAKGHVDHSLARARELGLIDDANFAKLFAEERLTLAKHGRKRVEADLRKRGVSRELIEAAMEAVQREHDPDFEWQSVQQLAKQKWKTLARVTDPMKKRNSLLRYLAGRGFSSELCYRALELFRNELDPSD